MKKKLVAATFAAGLGLAAFGSALAAPANAGTKGEQKCNSGRGNLSETEPQFDCDPGNSAKNKGGD